MKPRGGAGPAPPPPVHRSSVPADQSVGRKRHVAGRRPSTDQRHGGDDAAPGSGGKMTAMKKNVGPLDMTLRLVFAASLFYVGFLPNPIVTAETSQRVLGIFGFVPLATALLRFCPLYTLVGFTTCPKPGN